MKLLIITQKVDRNDQALGFFLDWLKEFAKYFEVVTVLCLQKGDFDLPANVRVYDLGKDAGLPKYRWLWNFYRQCWRLRHDYDPVFVHMNPIWVVVGWGLWRCLGKRINLWYTHKSVTLRLWLAEKLADKIFTASRESFRLPSKKVIVTGHGIDTELFRPGVPVSDEGVIRILSVGRITPVKNYEVLIDAAKILQNQGVSFAITLLGEPALPSDREYQAGLQAKIVRLGIDDTIHFLGRKLHRELPRYYQGNTIFVHMSQTGSLDKTILEAMACGMVVISCNDASRSFLPIERIFSSNNPVELAAKIKNPGALDFDGRGYVVARHSLSQLIARLASLL